MYSLYELAGVYTELLGRLEEMPEEAEEIYRQIEEINDAIGDRAEAYARIIVSKEQEAAGYDAEIKRLQELKKRAEGLVERLRGNLMAAMLAADAPKLHTSIGTWALRTNPPSVKVLDAKRVPEEYTVPQPSKIDKKAIMAAYKETGELIPGVEIVREKRVEFK